MAGCLKAAPAYPLRECTAGPMCRLHGKFMSWPLPYMMLSAMVESSQGLLLLLVFCWWLSSFMLFFHTLCMLVVFLQRSIDFIYEAGRRWNTLLLLTAFSLQNWNSLCMYGATLWSTLTSIVYLLFYSETNWSFAKDGSFLWLCLN